PAEPEERHQAPLGDHRVRHDEARAQRPRCPGGRRGIPRAPRQHAARTVDLRCAGRGTAGRRAQMTRRPPMAMVLSILQVLGAALFSTAAIAAELSRVSLRGAITIVALSGDLAQGDTEAADALIKAANDGNRLISAVRLDSPGGSLAEAIKLAG